MTTPHMPLPEIKTLALFNSWTPRQQILVFDSGANDFVPYTGDDVTVRLSRYQSGHDFEGFPSTILGPRMMSATAEAGWFFANIAADDLAPVLAPLVGQTIFQITEAAYGSTYFGVAVSQPIMVINPRAPIA